MKWGETRPNAATFPPHWRVLWFNALLPLYLLCRSAEYVLNP
ncbi:hypothetical protein Z948_1958 [Sulfitobacter donghicola DSW-25 = KCTC 12864 = JCM 14565]|nr:hypothetical protein Z948_1958 [Sulfitobacter donghicola DSW-25 = KCTC 12864 = JCM 14565]